MKTKKIRNLTSLLAIILFLASCISPFNYRINGNGNIVSQERIIDESYYSIELEDDYEVYIKEGANNVITIETDENLHDFVQTKIKNGKLVLSTTRGYSLKGSQGIIIYIETPSVENITLSGSGRIETDTISEENVKITISGSGEIYSIVNASNIDLTISGSGKIDVKAVTLTADVDISGSGDIILSGNANTTEMNISGSGSIRSYGLEQHNCDVNISGSGDVYVDVEQQLDVKISGSGNVNYIGTPTLSTNISGSGQINNLN
ncbi:MAG TPA: hypothetical protein DDX39_11615 [Bacteroidales bacterium]|nr:MAG: hypothetical protein A2W98_14210 [Bacteroidetes bacterium GWF2_33_38]OFY85340.1 MAG: hypothetical protein A2236_06860 [Bacteroidetes bacterium RIFOXYA2_FULL_33_7]HBF89278.1 hypothetical protein [Bacteroidales bacterium]